MSIKPEFRSEAIKLRKQGYSYLDISKITNISKSTLSPWLKDIPLTKKQKNILDKRWGKSYLIGAKAKKDQRIQKTKIIKRNAMLEIDSISKKEMLMLGAMLYWGEGTKEKETSISQGVEFVNSDSLMCKFFIKWVVEIMKVDINSIRFTVYINETKRKDKEKYINIWSKEINVPTTKINIYFTKNRYSNLKRSGKSNYKGQLRMVVQKSTDLNRRISGLINGICVNSKLVSL